MYFTERSKNTHRVVHLILVSVLNFGQQDEHLSAFVSLKIKAELND